ncbi:hypothetical protein BB560_007149 [Smittium megazygosporum]|uniref:tRNA pseudouridine synthase 1 n=1 Tax=Smittium megazygosporum TaxID=133381 RepID=A0A2T9XYI4_9FUNG|nr:hypothetical protein BB560_007149 [Smittium megazygosporum]
MLPSNSCIEDTLKRSTENDSAQSSESKKSKIETTNEIDTSEDPHSQRLPKRNVVLYLSYCGDGYQGMQVNQNAKTIEGDLFKALCQVGAISKDNSSDQKKVQLQRAARTDKGVHAARQLVSLKMILEDKDIIQKLNSALPDQIRVWGYDRVIKSFNPKNFCDSRIYEYLIPTYAFMPISSDTKQFIASAPLEQRKLYFFGNPLLSKKESKDTSNPPTFSPSQPPSEETPTKLSTDIEDTENPAENPAEKSNIKGNPYFSSESFINRATELRSSFRISPDLLSRVKSCFANYVGTHNFINFTVTKGTTGNNSSRFIKSISVSDPLLLGDGEWLSIKIHGQSFMLHQIRKMIGLVINIARTNSSPSLVKEILSESKKSNSARFNIPKAPGFGLLLDEPSFANYNKKLDSLKKNPNLERPHIDFQPYFSQIESFKSEFIYSKIIDYEKKKGSFLFWSEMTDSLPEEFPFLYNPIEIKP